MRDDMKRQIDKFEADYDKIFAKGVWTREDIENMKDLKKLVYYNKVICAMDEGEEYPGSEYIDEYSRSYARGRDRMGRYTSGRMYYANRSYDDEREDAIHKLHKLMDTETNQEFKMAIQEAIRMLETR